MRESNIMTETKTVGCTYELTEQGVHKFTFTGKGDKGLDEFFELVKPILQNSNPEMTLRYIVDTTQGQGKVSMVELAKRFRKLEVEVGSTRKRAHRDCSWSQYLPLDGKYVHQQLRPQSRPDQVLQR